MQTKKWEIQVVVLCLCLGVASACPAKVIYVDADAAGGNDGTSWADAYYYIQDALMFAVAGDEVHVAQGIYRPDDFVLSRRSNLGREETFQLINGVTLKGGYAGFGQADPNARDASEYETILSGDRDGNDVYIYYAEELMGEPTRAENSYHVVTGNGTDANAVLDGFTIRGGNADGPWGIYGGPYYGGGMMNSSGNPVVLNCVFAENSAGVGGGIYNIYSNPTLTDCTFLRNSGGGMHSFWGSRATLTNCMFRDNSSSYGGGLSDWEGNVLTNCTFIGNSARSSGGAISTDGSTIMDECTFIRNSAGYEGGGVHVIDNPTATFTGCVFESNFAGNLGGGVYVFQGAVELMGCTLRGNSASRGGALAFNGSYSRVTDSTLRSNSASQSGGGVWGGDCLSMTNCSIENNSAEQGGGMSTYGEPRLMNCTFAGNSAREGAGMYNNQSSAILINCTFNGNSAPMGNALACDSLDEWDPSEVELTECILWDGGNQIWNNDSSEIIIRYSDVKGGWPTGDNIDLDPCFASPGYWDPNGTPEDVNDDFWVDGDYHLKSQAGRWDANEGRWTIDDVTSPCIDAGNPVSPIGYEPFPNGGIVNMGAYGGTTEASKSYFGKPPCETVMAGDINGDCAVDFKDFMLMARHWLEERDG